MLIQLIVGGDGERPRLTVNDQLLFTQPYTPNLNGHTEPELPLDDPAEVREEDEWHIWTF